MVQIEMSKKIGEWICNQCTEVMVLMAKSRIEQYTAEDVEYWNAIIVHQLMVEVELKFKKKMLQKRFFFKVELTPAEAYTLYCFLYNFPIYTYDYWKIQQRQFIIDQLHRTLLIEPQKTKQHEHTTS
jgi:hypothetical protein